MWWSEHTFHKTESNNLMLLWASIFSVFKKFSLCHKVIRYISSLFPQRRKGGALFPVKHLLFKNVRGVALLVAALAAIPATALHFAQGINLMAATMAMSAVPSLFGSLPLSSPDHVIPFLPPFTYY